MSPPVLKRHITEANLSHVFLMFVNLFSEGPLEFVDRKNQVIELLPKGIEFVSIPQRRAILLAESALKIEAFS
jgi:hypothetical protein